MAGYSLIGAESTVQVLSPTVVEDVVYCTIMTSPSNVIASIPVSQASFTANQSAELLTAFADGIETIIGRGNIIAGTGRQSLDANGLLADTVAFTVQFVPTGNTATSITADAIVPVGLLSQSDPAIAQTTLAEAEAIVTGVYNNLKSAAGG